MSYEESETVPMRRPAQHPPLPEGAPPRTRRDRRATRARRRRAGVVLATGLLLLAVVVGGGIYLFGSAFTVADFDGDGTGSVVVEVAEGATTTQIGADLAGAGVVAGTDAFLRAAAQDERVRSVQPGFYQLREQMSGTAAVALLLDPAARVGRLEIRGGVQLDDTSTPDGTVSAGVLSIISRAVCAGVEASDCPSAEDLRAAMAETDPAELGVPEWALTEVTAAEPVRRLEGLLLPNVYDVRPGTPAVQVLQQLLAESVPRLEATGLVEQAPPVGMTPYQVLVIASLIEKEGITADMPTISRVIYNRLAAGQRLELDSTVNYPLDRQSLRTRPEDRAVVGPYNSYAVEGLPPTPIAAPGRDAIAAALEPADGPWLYFVRCRPDGTSCFGTTLAEHSDNIDLAIENGAI